MYFWQLQLKMFTSSHRSSKPDVNRDRDWGLRLWDRGFSGCDRLFWGDHEEGIAKSGSSDESHGLHGWDCCVNELIKDYQVYLSGVRHPDAAVWRACVHQIGRLVTKCWFNVWDVGSTLKKRLVYVLIYVIIWSLIQTWHCVLIPSHNSSVTQLIFSWTFQAHRIPENTNICIAFIQRRPNVSDVGPTLYNCYTNVVCLLGWLQSLTNLKVHHTWVIWL